MGKVKKAINLGANSNCVDAQQYHYTPLIFAIRRKRFAIVDYLLKQKADLNLSSNSSKTPLHYAVESRIRKIVKLLIHAKSDVKARNFAQETPLHAAIWHNQPLIIKLLLKAKSEVNAQDSDNRTPLHIAKSPCVAKLLLKEKAGIYACDFTGTTPLYTAARMGYTAVIETLLAHGAQPGIGEGKHPGLEKSSTCFHKTLGFEQELSQEKYSLLATLFYGTAETVKDLITSRAMTSTSINKPYASDMTPLMWAAVTDNESVIQALLYSTDTPDISVTNTSGETALMLARKYKKAKAEWLLYNALNPIKDSIVQCIDMPDIVAQLICTYLAGGRLSRTNGSAKSIDSNT